jgi:DNA-directed RNA polymerase II subunit RPB1
MSITRHGINRQDVGPLMKCSFEEPVDIFMESAAHAEYDPLKGVSENILLGKLAKVGTGAFEVFLDVKKCASAMEIPMDNDDAFNGWMSNDAMEDFNKQQLTPWIGSISTTPTHKTYSLSTFEECPSPYSSGYSIVSPSPMPPSPSPSPYTNITTSNHQSPSYLSTSPHYSTNTPNPYGSKSSYYKYFFICFFILIIQIFY